MIINMISFFENLLTSILVGLSSFFGIQTANPDLSLPVNANIQQEAKPKSVSEPSNTTQVPNEEMMIVNKDGESTYFYKDLTRVWISGEMPPDPFIIPDADPKTFEPLKFPYSKDAYNVYFWDTPIQSAATSTFRVINASTDFPFGVDQYNVFSGSKVLQGADPLTFKFDTTTFTAQDKYRVYDLNIKMSAE